MPWCVGNAPVNLVEWTGAIGRTLPYEIYRDGNLIASVDLDNRYTDTLVTSGTTYKYFVRAKNTAGTRDTNETTVLSKSDCAAPVAPKITAISPQAVVVGSGDFTLTVTGQNFDSSAKLLWDYSGNTPSTVVQLPTVVSSTTMSIQINQTSDGFFPFLVPSALALQVIKPGDTNFFDGLRSNILDFAVFNPIPVVTSVSGHCRANLNCVPSNGYDVRVNGSGFINNIVKDAVYISSTYAEINGKSTSISPIGQGPVFTQMQLWVNGALIPTPGAYSLQVCNAGTTQGTQCSTASLIVDP